MLADTSLLKKQIGTEMKDFDLGIHRAPESIADPKQAVEEAIQKARQILPKRKRRELKIGELYQPIGQVISLKALSALPSYQKFETNVRSAFRELKLLM